MALPSGYTRLEYITSTGTQYIDSGLTGNQKTRIDIDYSRVASQGVIIGADTTWLLNDFVVGIHFAAFGTSNYSYSSVPTGRHLVSLNRGALYVDGSLVNTMTSGSFDTSVNMAIFALNRNNSIREYGSVTLYSLKIYNDDALVRDYIPCKNTSGAIGLWDNVNSIFYQNSGTGTFTAGPEVEVDESALYVKINGVWKKIENITINVK